MTGTSFLLEKERVKIESKQNNLAAANAQGKEREPGVDELRGKRTKVHLFGSYNRAGGLGKQQQGNHNLGDVLYQCVLVAVVNHPSFFDGRAGATGRLPHRLNNPH